MKKYYLFLLPFFIVFLSITESNAQGTETFEAPLPVNSTSFTRAGLTFTSSSANFDTDEFAGAGAGGSDRYIDNIDAPATNSTYSISITGGATLFTMQSMEVYVSSFLDGSNPTADGTMTFTGFDGATQVYTATKTTGFPTTFGATNGFFLLDFSALPGFGDASGINIDRIQVTINGAFQYFAIDNFEFDNEVLEADPPEVQSITVVGTPPSTATSVDFLVTFNENANNVSIDDFSLDTVGTFGTIASVSSATGIAITVTVNGISGEGTISIDLNAGTNIEDDLGNTPPPAFTAGENHFVSRCFQETFESFLPGDFMFSSNGITFETGTANFSVENFGGGGAGGSDQFLSNFGDQGTGKVYSITTSGPELFTVEALDIYLSSQANGANPTNDGTLTLEGRLTGSTLYTIQKTTGFPTDFSVNNGFYTVDFATEGASDYSLTNIDELRITIGGAFIYISLDNFEHCEEVTAAAPPIVQSIKLIGNPPANSASVNFEVIFNENANLVSTDDFSLNLQGSAVGTIASVSGSGNTYNVLVNAISGEGSLRLDLNPGTDIEDDSGNTPPDPFTDGERFIVSICDVETFEGLADGTFTWTTNTVPWASQGAGFSVDEFIGAGAGGSDRYIDNVTSQGTGDINTIAITDTQMVKMGSMEIYVSSQLNGDNPTDDGTLTVRGKLDGTTLYTVTKSTGFPTTFGSTQGFYLWDFATEGGTDHSMTDVDEIELELGGAFQYLAVDNFKFCMDPPDETEVALAGGALTITDINGGTSDDNITLSVVGPNLRITNTVARFQISGAGVVEVDDNTVDVLLANITNGIIVDAISGNDAISITTALNLPGASNSLTIQNFDSFSQTPGSDVSVGSDLTYNIGGPVDFRNTTAGGNLMVTTIGNIGNWAGAVLNITGITTLNAGAGNIQLNGNHNFVDLINASGNIVSISGTPPGIWNLNDITATSTIGFTNNSHGLTFNGVISGPGLVQLRGGGTEGLLQVAGTISADLLEMAAGGQNIDVSQPGNDANFLRLYSTNNATFVDIDDITFADVNVNNVTITAPTINFGGGSLVTLNSGASNFNGDVTSAAGSVLNHNGGSVDFNGTSINLSSLQYNGQAGTTTNMNGGLITAGGGLTFQDLFVNTGDYQTNNITTTINGIALFSGTGNLIGTGSINGEVVIGAGGELAAGNSPGCLSTGDLTLVGGSTTTFEVTGITPCTLHDQIQVTGDLFIDPAANVNFLVGYANGPTDEIILILNDGVDPISGTFNGYPEGTAVTFGAFSGTITYTGGDGNDVSIAADTVPPTVTCPSDITQNNDPGTCGAVVNFTVTATDNNPGVTLVVNPPSGSTFPVGTTLVTATATDAAGNTATCSFNVTVNDVEDPTITCPADITINNDPGICGAVVNYLDPTVSDNCSLGVTTLTFSYTGSAQSFIVPSGVTSINIEAWGASGQGVTVEQYTPSTGGLGGYATGDLAVTPGDVIWVYVGGTGTDGAGGFNGGAIGGFGTAGSGGISGFAGSGGGASDVRIGAATLNDRIIVAGGGGGGGRDYVNGSCQPCGQGGNGGAGGGTLGVDGEDPTDPIYGFYFNPGAGGKGGTQIAGGLGGDGPQGPDGNPGVIGDGGIGINGSFTIASGGGGGGYYGGGSGAGANIGSGAAGAGGAGGASYIGGVINGSTNNGVRSGDGEIILSWANSGSVTQTAGLPSGSVFPVGTTINTFEITDASGNTATCSFEVIVNDNEPPVVTCPADITVSNDPGDCGAIVSFTPTITDNCPGSTVSSVPASGSFFPVGTTLVTVTGTDASGNIVTCTFNVIVNDTEDPTISCPADITINNDAGVCGAVVTYTTPMGTDNCPGSTTVQTEGLASGSTFPVGTTTNTFLVTDASGNTATCSFDVTVIDAEDPTISCPGDITVNNDPGVCGAVVNYTVTESDNCTTALNQIPDQTSSFTGNARGYWFTAPVDFVMTGLRVPTTASSADQNVMVMRFDAVPPNFASTGPYADLLHWSGQVPGNGFIPVNISISAGDIIGILGTRGTNSTNSYTTGTNIVIAGINVSIDRLGTQNDIHNAPAPQGSFFTEVGSPNQSRVEFEYMTPITTQTAGLPSGSVFPVGTTTNTFVTTDGAGNTATCSFTVTVNDAEPPVITCPANITVNNDPGVCGAIVTYTAPTSGDNCPGETVSQTAGLTSGSVFPVGTTTNTFVVTDASGNTATCSFDVTVNDTEPPVASCVAPFTIQLDATGNASITFGDIDNGSTDNCAIDTMTINPSSFTCANVGPNTVTLTVTDVNGNSSTCTTTVTVEDNVPPVAVCQNITIDLDPDGNATITPADVDGGSTDACGIASLSIDVDTFDCSDVGTNPVVLTVTDVNGNSSQCTAIVTVQDVTPPVIACPADIVANTDLGVCGAQVFFADPIATDACGIASVVLTDGLPSGSIFPVGVSTVEFTATDVNGNTNICTFTVTITDNEPPMAICQDITIQLDEFGNASITPADIDGGSSDNCAIDTITASQTIFDCSDVGPNDVILTVTDIYGNTSTCIAVVTVEDVTPPNVICMDITVELDENGTITISGIDVDGGSTDACGIFSYELDIDTFDCSDVGENVVVLTVTDVNGNTSTCTAIVTVVDATDPELVCMDITVELDENGQASITPEDVIASNTDACGILTTAVDIPDFDCDDIGAPIEVTVFSQDVNGNISSCTALVTVIDLLPPVIENCPDDLTVDPGVNNLFYEVPDYWATAGITATDNCTDPITLFSQDPAPGTLLPDGVYTISICATDEYGNEGCCTFELTVESILGNSEFDYDISTIVMYPNPAKAIVNISNPQAIPLDNVTLYDVTGRLVKTFDLRNMGTEKALDIATLASATYVVIIQSETGTITKQLIKE